MRMSTINPFLEKQCWLKLPFGLSKLSHYCFFILLLLTSLKSFSQCAVTGSATTTVSCSGTNSGSATITLAGTGSGAPGTYTVDGGSPQSFSGNPFTITALAAGSHTVVATVTAGPCVSSNIVFNIASSALAFPTITASATPAAICIGSSTTLNGSGASTYSWTPGALSGSSVNVSPIATTTYTVTGTNADGCSRSNSWVKIAAGSNHTLAIKSDGTLWAWGWNNNGQLGDGTNVDKNSPIQIGSASDWAIVAAGNNHSLAIKTNGTLWGWGFNSTGQVGDGTLIDKTVPTQIGVITTWSNIACGGTHSLATRTNGTLWGWGNNFYGQVGDASSVNRNAPVQIGVATTWANFAGGNEHSLAVKTDGTLWAWGRNTFGQIGDGSGAAAHKNAPVQVGIETTWSKVSAGFFHSLATKTNGTLWSWGYNLYGQLGDATNANKIAPVQVGVATDWANVEAGLYYSLAKKTTGTIWGFGQNAYGQIGDGTTADKNVPVQSGSATTWNLFSAGFYHTIATKNDATMWAWGYNMPYGQLGDGTGITKITAVQINSPQVTVTVTVNPLPTVSFSGLSGPYCLAAPAVTLTGSPVGGTFSGPGISGNTFTPLNAGAGTHTITYTYTNANGCTNSATQSVTVTFTELLNYVNLQFPGTANFCQGGSVTVYGQIYEPGLTEAAGAGSGVTVELGYSKLNTNPSTWTNWQPAVFNVQVGNNDEYMSTLRLPSGTYYYAFRYAYTLNNCGYQYGGYSAGGGHYWDGTNYISGVLTVNTLPSILVSPFTIDICYGTSTTLTATGTSTYTWMPGSLTGSSVTVSPTSTTMYTVVGTTAAGCSGVDTWVSIAAGAYHNLGIKSNGTLWAFGVNLSGQLGDGTNTDRNIQKQIGTATNWAMISAGSSHSLAIKSDGTLWAWGLNTSGQLGDGTIVSKNSPVQIGSATNWVAIAAGGDHSLALRADGTLWAWGLNTYGQIGDNTGTQRNNPVQIGSATNWSAIAAGSSYGLALKSNGTLWAWGRNNVGQLGDGTTTGRGIPTQIGTATTWTKIAAGFFHSSAIRSNGTLWAWGQNTYGQVGDATFVNKLNPVQISSAINWESVEVGYEHTLAIKSNGSLWGWGRNNYFQLGDGTIINRNVPGQIGADTDWLMVDAGAYHSLATKVTGPVYNWGRSMEGQLGNGSTGGYVNTPTQPVNTWGVSWVGLKPHDAISVTATKNTICSGEIDTLSANYSGVTYNWMPGNLSGGIVYVSPTSTTTYTVTGTDDITGCALTPFNITITVNQGPVVSFTGLNPNYCITDGAVTLTGSPAGGTFSGTGVSGNIFDPAAAGVGGPYSITYSVAGACTSQFTQSVNVLALPAVSFNGLVADICENGAPLTLTGFPSGGSFSGPGITGNSFDPVAAGVGGPYSITYTYTNANGCTNSTSQQITVHGFAGGAVSFTGLASSYCTTSGTVTLTGNQPGGTFTGAGITNNGVGTALFNPAAAGLGTHTITYTYSNGTCSNAASQSVSVLSNYTITSSAGTGGTIFPNGAVQVCSGNSQGYIFTPDMGYHIADVVVDGISFGILSDFLFPNVTESHIITVNFAADCVTPGMSSTIINANCNGQSNGSVDIDVTSGTAPFTYQWSGPDDFTATSQDISNVAAGVYTLTVTATGGCTTTEMFTVTEPAALQLSCSGTNVTCNGLNNGTATVSVTGGTGNYSYSWTNGSTSGSVTLNAMKDNTIYAENVNNSNALGEYLAIGNDDIGAVHRGLMAFDIAGNLPAGAIVSSASLKLNCSRSAPGSGVQPIYLHRLTTDWGEGNSFASQTGVGTAATTNDATWSSSYFPSIVWANAGGDFVSGSSAVTNVNAAGIYNWSSAGMVNDLQQWLNNPSSNYGWVIKSNETGTFKAKRLDSRENANAANNPELTINYSVPNILSTTNTLSDLPPGSYTVTVTDENGCSASCTYTVTEPVAVSVSFSGLAGPYCTSDPSVTLTGSPAGGSFSGPGITGNSFNPGTAGIGTHNIVYSYTNSGCTTTSTQQVTVNNCSAFTTLELKIFLEGFYSGTNTMRANRFDLGLSNDPTETDEITVSLWSVASLANETPDYSATAILHTDGTADMEFPAAVDGNSWFIAVKHRNHIETWSSQPVLFSNSTSYDFSSDITQAYDDGINAPMALMSGGEYAIYGGDVNQDGGIDASDLGQTFNDANTFEFGYIPSDVTGDGGPDASDLALIYNNSQLFLFYARPY